MRLIKGRSAIEALVFAWLHLGLLFRSYWWLLAIGTIADTLFSMMRAPLLQYVAISMTAIAPFLLVVRLAELTVRLERLMLGVILVCGTTLSLGIPSFALLRLQAHVTPPINVVFFIVGLVLYVFLLKVLPLGFIYAFGGSSLPDSFRKTWLSVRGLDWWNILGVFVLSWLPTIPAAFASRALILIHAPIAIRLLAACLLVVSANAWAFLALGAFSSIYAFAEQPERESQTRPVARRIRATGLRRWFARRDPWIW